MDRSPPHSVREGIEGVKGAERSDSVAATGKNAAAHGYGVCRRGGYYRICANRCTFAESHSRNAISPVLSRSVTSGAIHS